MDKKIPPLKLVKHIQDFYFYGDINFTLTLIQLGEKTGKCRFTKTSFCNKDFKREKILKSGTMSE